MRKIQAFKKFTFTLDYTTSLGLTKRTITLEISQAVRFLLVFLVLTSDENGCRISSTIKGKKALLIYAIVGYRAKRLG